MAHFAEIDSNNIVLRVLLVPDEQEHRGQEYLADDLGMGGTWLQTSFNGKIRGAFAALGMTYDAILDRFLPPKLYPSWILSDDFGWVAPVGFSFKDGYTHKWNEENMCWDEIPDTTGE